MNSEFISLEISKKKALNISIISTVILAIALFFWKENSMEVELAGIS